ncbi:hypothetical protein HOY34_07620 [Xinfangfangia sp. D13-10-4-6]|uniref:DUF7007 domain-containing protein n=1 Tax=Pseudogemmobacter hezensis TaxID=2737662 RepID=UPI001555C499|nr:hypothetical protein [Pseudogemmobacter hezensis]NPD15071.1 hypothetical protein [Pseudogemmobacter hezensis]
MTTSVPIIADPSATKLPVVEFGCSAEDFAVARVGDTAFAMLPNGAGRHFLATGWRLTKPLGQWTRQDFYGHCGLVVDEAAFRAQVNDNAGHQREVAALGRREVIVHANTPWGPSQGGTVYAEGVVFHSTAGHGGFHLDPFRNLSIHPALRKAQGFYEEDAEWAAVAQGLPELFTTRERRLADETIRNHWPEAWEKIHGRILQPGESHERDRQAFDQKHAGNWIVISALRSDHHPGFTEVIATRGGKRGERVEERRFLVPSAEYRAGPFGFVIDETQHEAYDGPSSFVGWAMNR